MAKAASTSDSHGNPPYNTVFIDTSLDTHIAMIVSDVDTVADLKEKILLEHPLCFPGIGKIKILALKVKKKGYFYHLSDSMFVRSAFDGVKKAWFVYVDASSLVEQSKIACNPESGNMLLCLPTGDGADLQPDEHSKKLSILDESPSSPIRVNQSTSEKAINGDEFGFDDPHVEHSKVLEMAANHISDDHFKTSATGANKKSDPEIQEECNLYSRGIELLGTRTEHESDDSGNIIGDMQNNDPLEGALKTQHAAKRKRNSKRKHRDALSDHALKENNAPIHASGKATSQPENMIPENSLDKTGVEVQGKLVEGQDIKLKDMIDVQCNDSLEGIPQPRHAAKKKRKTVKNNESEGPLKENEALICNFNKETSGAKILGTDNSLENELKFRDSNLDGLSGELPEPDCSMTTHSSSGRKKRKKKSSDLCDQAVAAVPSEKYARQESLKATLDVNQKDSGREPDTTISHGESIENTTRGKPCALSLREKHCDPVQAVEENQIAQLSPGINMNGADASNVGTKSDVSERAATYGIKRKKTSKKHHAVDGRGRSGKEVDSLRKDFGLPEYEDVAPGDHLILGINQTDKIEGEREMPQNRDPNGMLSEKCRSSRYGGSETSTKEVVASAKLVDANRGVEHGDPAANKGRKLRKAKNFAEGTPVTSNVGHVKDPASGFASTEPDKAFNGNFSSNEANKEESILSQTEGTEILKTKAGKTSFLDEGGKTDEINRNEVESFHLDQISKTQENTENMDDRMGKKTKKKRSSITKNLPDLQKKKQDVGLEGPSSFTHKNKDGDAPPKVAKKTKLVKTRSTNPSKRSKLETVNDAATEVESSHPKQVFETVGSSQTSSYYALENNSVGRPLEADIDGNPSKIGCINEASDHKEVSSYQIDMGCMHRQPPHEVVAPAERLAGKETKVKRSERQSKTNKNKKGSDAHLEAPSQDPQNSLKTYEKQSIENKSVGDNQLQDPLSMDGHNKLMPESDSKFSEVPGDGLKVPPSHDIGKFDSTPEVVGRPIVINASHPSSSTGDHLKRTGEASLSSSSSDSSEDRIRQNRRGKKRQSSLDRYRVTVRKAPSKNTEIVNSSHQRKSLLATYGSIFTDGGNESSEDDDLVENSNASTRTPSDSSASSDHPEGESSQNLDSPRGFYGAKGNESGAKSISRSNLSGSKNVTMDVILRSSSRYKKAKLNASQSERNDPESQPVEFVPDSQANL